MAVMALLRQTVLLIKSGPGQWPAEAKTMAVMALLRQTVLLIKSRPHL